MCYHGRGGFFFSSFSSCLSLSTSFYFKCINRDPLGGHGAGGADGMGEGVMVSFCFSCSTACKIIKIIRLFFLNFLMNPLSTIKTVHFFTKPSYHLINK